MKNGDPKVRESGTKRPSILLVDDEPVIAELVAMALRKHNYTVEVHHDGRSAWQAFQKDPDAHDLVLTDVMMPFMDGPTMLRHILSIRPKIPFVILTGIDQDEVNRLNGELDAAAFLVKPVRLNILLSSINRALANVESAVPKHVVS